MDNTKMKLQQELSNLACLKETMSKSSQLTTGMCNILNSFDTRLSKLEQSVIPLYTQTGNLQLKQQNIEKTIQSLDYYIQFYNLGKEVEQVIREGPSGNIENYLENMNRLCEALKFFSRNNPNSPENENLTSLFEAGSNALGKEFRSLLTRYSRPIPPILILDALNMDEDDEDKITIEQFPASGIADLVTIATWLRENKNEDFANVYAAIRANIIQSSIKGLKDHQKSSSGGSYSHPSPLLTRRANATPAKKPKGLMPQVKLMKKAAGALVKYGQATTDTITLEQSTKDEISEQEVMSYLTCFSALYLLLESEQSLLKGIIPDDQQHKIFERICEPSLQVLCTEGENLSARVRRCAARHDFSSVLCLFPVLKHLQTIRPDFDELFRGFSSNVKGRLHSVIITLQTTINKSLEEFVDSIRNHPDTKMPRDGTVHEVTSNVMVLLEQLHEYLDLLPGSLSVSDQAMLVQSQEPSKMVLAQYIMRVLSALGLMLTSKSEVYSDIYLKAIFRLNNLHYILKSLQRKGLLDIVSLCSPNIKEYYNDQIMDQKRIYSQSWSRVLHYVLEVDKPISQQHTSPSFVANLKLKDKDKQNIKDKFTGFNREMEEITRVQKGYAIPDPELKSSLKENNKEFILPKYQLFYDKYSAIPFSKNPEKYLRYSVEDVSRMIDQFFDAAA